MSISAGLERQSMEAHRWRRRSCRSTKGAVVFSMWRCTEIDVTLGLVFVAAIRKEWPMTFIAVRCPHCQSDQIVKRGKTRRGTQRYLCQNTACPPRSFLLEYRYQGRLPEVKPQIIDMSLNASGVRAIPHGCCASVPTPCCVRSGKKKPHWHRSTTRCCAP